MTEGPEETTDTGRVLTARGRKTQARLLDAGRTVFMRQGYHAARVDDIVALLPLARQRVDVYRNGANREHDAVTAKPVTAAALKMRQG